MSMPKCVPCDCAAARAPVFDSCATRPTAVAAMSAGGASRSSPSAAVLAAWWHPLPPHLSKSRTMSLQKSTLGGSGCIGALMLAWNSMGAFSAGSSVAPSMARKPFGSEGL